MRLDTPHNRARAAAARKALDALLDAATVRGFHGTAWLKLTIKDGSVLEVHSGQERSHREPAEAEADPRAVAACGRLADVKRVA